MLSVLIHLILQIVLWCRDVVVSTGHYKETKAQKGYTSVQGLAISIDREACLFDLSQRSGPWHILELSGEHLVNTQVEPIIL